MCGQTGRLSRLVKPTVEEKYLAVHGKANNTTKTIFGTDLDLGTPI